MEFIEIHSADFYLEIEKLERYASRSIPKKMVQAKAGKADWYGTLAFTQPYLFNAFRLQQVDPPKIKACLQLLLQVLYAEVEFNLTDRESVELPFGGEKVSHAVSKNQRTGVTAWNLCFYYALIARAKELLAYLKEAHAHSMMMTHDLYSSFFQAQHSFLIELGSEMEARMLKDAEAELANISPDLRPVQSIYFPLWKPVIEKDQAEFDRELRASLARHQNYWGQPQGKDKDHPNDPDGHYSFYLTAIMSEAHDRGLEINLHSDYTPLPLVKGDFQVDLETELEFYF